MVGVIISDMPTENMRNQQKNKKNLLTTTYSFPFNK